MSGLEWLTARPIAHRGLHDGNRKVWENTLSAFKLAMDAGNPIECDVHLTSDGQVIVFHDSDLKRLTGREGKVHKMSMAQMSALHIGGTGDRPATLIEMLAFVDGKVPLIIELKGDKGHDEGLVEAVAHCLAGYKGKAAVMSFEHHLIRLCKKHMPHIPCGLTAEGMTDNDIEAHFAMLAHGIDFVSYHVHHLPNRFITFVREKLSMPVITWTVRTPEEFAKTYKQADQATFEGIDPDKVGTV